MARDHPAIIADAPFEDQQLYIQVTRGADVKRDQPFPVKGVPQTVFMFTAPMVKPTRRNARQRRRLRHRARHPLGPLRPEDRRPARQLASPPDLGRRRLHRNDHDPRRLPDRRLGLQRLHRQERRRPRAAEGQPHPARHHLRRRLRTGRQARRAARSAPDHRSRSARRRRNLGHLLDQGSPAGHHADGKPVGHGDAAARSARCAASCTRVRRLPRRVVALRRMPDKAPAQDTLLEFPCAFPLKIMGLASDGLAQAVLEVVLRTRRISTARRWKCAPRAAASTSA
jgi:hypothetical protein